MKNRQLEWDSTTDDPRDEIERLRAMLMAQEILRHARRDGEHSEIASLKRRLSDRDGRMRKLEAALRERTRHLSIAVMLVAALLVGAWF